MTDTQMIKKITFWWANCSATNCDKNCILCAKDLAEIIEKMSTEKVTKEL